MKARPVAWREILKKLSPVTQRDSRKNFGTIPKRLRGNFLMPGVSWLTGNWNKLPILKSDSHLLGIIMCGSALRCGKWRIGLNHGRRKKPKVMQKPLSRSEEHTSELQSRLHL